MIVDSMDPVRLPGVVLRGCIDRQGLPRTCAIRKCRRDNACTGPFVSFDPQSLRFVPSRPSDDPGASLPPCCHALDQASFAALAHLHEKVLELTANQPGKGVLEQTRAIAARSWAGASFAAEPPPETQKPLPSENIRAKAAPETDIGEQHAP